MKMTIAAILLSISAVTYAETVKLSCVEQSGRKFSATITVNDFTGSAKLKVGRKTYSLEEAASCASISCPKIYNSENVSVALYSEHELADDGRRAQVQIKNVSSTCN